MNQLAFSLSLNHAEYLAKQPLLAHDLSLTHVLDFMRDTTVRMNAIFEYEQWLPGFNPNAPNPYINELELTASAVTACMKQLGITRLTWLDNDDRELTSQYHQTAFDCEESSPSWVFVTAIPPNFATIPLQRVTALNNIAVEFIDG